MFDFNPAINEINEHLNYAQSCAVKHIAPAAKEVIFQAGKHLVVPAAIGTATGFVFNSFIMSYVLPSKNDRLLLSTKIAGALALDNISHIYTQTSGFTVSRVVSFLCGQTIGNLLGYGNFFKRPGEGDGAVIFMLFFDLPLTAAVPVWNFFDPVSYIKYRFFQGDKSILSPNEEPKNTPAKSQDFIGQYSSCVKAKQLLLESGNDQQARQLNCDAILR